jgi:hypothetical protein
LSGKSNVSNVAPAEYVDALRENIMPIAPSGMVQVHVADGSVTNANDTALKLAL